MESDSVPRVAVRSCMTCSKAKAKCVRRVGEETCERCSRLKKECFSKDPVMKRRKSIKTSRAAQLEKLENKIEHLVNALSTQQASTRSETGQLSPPVSQISTQVMSERNISRATEVLESLCREPTQTELDGVAGSVSEGTGPAGVVPWRSSAVTLSEAESLLSRFRRLMSAGLPFVVMPHSMTAQELYRSKPVLLRAITTVTLFHDLPRQQLLVKDLLRDISERIMIKGEKSVDLLQAILVFVCWYHPHIFWSHQITNLLHLAIAMTVDLGIGQSATTCGNFQSQRARVVHGPNVTSRTPTLEEHRVLLGLFFLTSMLSASFNKCDAMPFTRRMEDYLTSLEQAREYDSDLFLVQMVRIQRVIESVDNTDTTTVPAKIYQKAFQADLRRLRETDPCKEDNTFLRMQYLTTEISIWELSLTELVEDKRKPLSQFLDDLFRCVRSINEFLDIYFTIPSSAYLLVPFTVFGQFAHAFIVLTKLASLEIEGWGQDALDEQLDFRQIIDKAAHFFDESVKSAPDGYPVNNGSLGKWAGRVRWMKHIWEAKFRDDNSASNVLERGQQSSERQGEYLGQPTPPDDLSLDFFSYLDENFWQALGSYNGELDFGAFPVEQTIVT